jgi:hypothetical protein
MLSRFKVLIKLSDISKTQDGNSSAAQKAIHQVNMAVSDNKDVVRIMNQSGADVSNQAVTKGPSPEPSGPLIGEEILIGITRRASDLSEVAVECPPTKAKPAVLLTDNKRTRVKAGREGVPSLGVDMIRKYVMRGVNRLRSASNASSNGSRASSRQNNV